MDLTKLFHPYYQTDAGSGSDDEETEDGAGGNDAEKAGKKKVEFDADQQKELNRLVGEARTKEREKARLEAEAKVKEEKDAAERKALEEQGKHKELAEAAEKKAIAEKERADKAEAETKKLKLQRKFDETVTDLGVKFVNPKAGEDAFEHLDLDKVGEDFSGIEAAVKALIDERGFLFEDAEKVDSIDATEKGKLRKNVNKDELAKKKKQTGKYNVF